MAILKAVNVKIGRNASLKGIINYVLQHKKTEEQLITGICCDVPSALSTMLETKKMFNKNKGRQYYHFVQSFPPNEKNIDPKKAHEIALEFAENCKKFWGFEMIVATHRDREHLHTHFVMNSVSFLDGHKFHITRKELAMMKEMQNQICIKHGFSQAPKKGFDIFGRKRKKIVANNSKAFHMLTKAKDTIKDSYIFNCSEALIRTIKMARTKDQFMKLMHANGFDTEWNEKNKHIVFTDISRKNAGEKKYKVRLKRLSQYIPELCNIQTKEDIENEFRRNEQSNNNRYFAATDDGNKSRIRENTEFIDLNSRFEKYSSDIDRERTVRAVEEIARQPEQLVESASKMASTKSEYNQRGNKNQSSDIEEELGRNETDEGYSW